MNALSFLPTYGLIHNLFFIVAAGACGWLFPVWARAQMVEMGPAEGSEGMTMLKFLVPTRGMIGVRSALLTATKGTVIIDTIFDSYKPVVGAIRCLTLSCLSRLAFKLTIGRWRAIVVPMFSQTSSMNCMFF